MKRPHSEILRYENSKCIKKDEEEPDSTTHPNKKCISNYYQKLTEATNNYGDDDNTNSNSDKEQLFRQRYKSPRLSRFISFDHIDISASNDDGDDDDGIPKRAGLFNGFDFVNFAQLMVRYDKPLRKAYLLDYYHITKYFHADIFTKDIFKTRKYDSILNAMVSFLLEWDDESLQHLHNNYGINKKFIESLIKYRNLDGGAYIYSFHGRAVCKCAIKILKSYFDVDDDDAAAAKKETIFEWTRCIDPKLIAHFRELERLICNNKPIDMEMRKKLESKMNIPYKLPNIDENLEDVHSYGPVKFITGVACAGKTTMLNELRKNNWKIYSRGDIGSFSGKANDPATIASLYAAQNYILSQNDTIGDRSMIDNVVWQFIMEYCNSECFGRVVTDFLQFLNSKFNEPSIMAFIMDRGLIFLDTNFEANAQRMMSRNTDGDSHRSRIRSLANDKRSLVNSYASTQFLVYYMCARLFGWKVKCVPYDNDNNYEPKRYYEIYQDIHKYFIETPCCVTICPTTTLNGYGNGNGNGSVMTLQPESSNLTCPRFKKPSNEFISNMTYPKAIGIYK